jgi:hypothetical protein
MKQLTYLFFLLPFALYSQQDDITLEAIYEYRSLDSTESVLEVFLKYDTLFNDDTRVKLIDAHAYDDLENFLPKKESRFEKDEYESISSSYIELHVPSRAASRLEKIVVELEVLSPTEDNGAIIYIHPAQNKLNQNLLESYTKDAILIRIDSLEYYRDEHTLVEDGHLVVQNTLDMQEEKLPSNAAYFFMEDPSNEVLEYNLLDAEGNEIMNTSIEVGGMVYDIEQRMMKFKNQENWIIKVVLKKETAIKQYKLEFFDVDLY